MEDGILMRVERRTDLVNAEGSCHFVRECSVEVGRRKTSSLIRGGLYGGSRDVKSVRLAGEEGDK